MQQISNFLLIYFPGVALWPQPHLMLSNNVAQYSGYVKTSGGILIILNYNIHLFDVFN